MVEKRHDPNEPYPEARGATRALASFGAQLKYEDIPKEVTERTKELLVDYISTVIPAAHEDPAQRLIRFAQSMGGPPQSSIVGTGIRVAPPWAAMVNGSLGHMMELDDTHRLTMAHPGDSIHASALAIGQHKNVSGKELLTAAVAGYEVALRIGESVMPGHYLKGWHSSGTMMTFGAAMVAARLLGLDAQQSAWALGTAGAQACGNFAHLAERAMTKDFNCGHAAKSGVIAALLAEQGFTGPTDVVENRRGFMALYGEGERHPHRLTDGLGERWNVMEVSQKAYSGCRYCHPAMDAILSLRRQHGFTAADVQRVNARVLRTGANLVNDPCPWEGDKALQGTRFSVQFNIAVALVKGREGLWDLLDAAHPLVYRDEPEVRQAMSLVDVVPDDELDKGFPDKWGTVIAVALRDGRTVEQAVDWPTGEPEVPMTPADRDRKFRTLMGLAKWPEQKTEALLRYLQSIERESDLSGLSPYV